MSHLTYPEAAVIGLIQGVTELFPVSSLGHAVLLPALIGGSWAADLNAAAPSSPYLAFVVGLHVATAIGIFVYFWRDWIRIIGAFFSTLIHRRIESADERLAWMIILATIPVGLVGLVADHETRVLFAKPVLAGVFLVVNGVDPVRRRAVPAATVEGGRRRDRAGSPGRGQPGRRGGGPRTPPASGPCASRRCRPPCGPTSGWPGWATCRAR